MNRKQFIILLVLVAVIGGAGLVVHQHNRQSWQNADDAIGHKLLPKLAVNDIAEIQIRSGTNVLKLAKQNDIWQVTERGGYPADFPKLSDLLLKLTDLKVVQTDQVGPSQLGRFQLLPPGSGTNSATLLEFKNQGGTTLATLLLGKQHLQKPPANSQFGGMGNSGWPDGRYVMVGTDAKNVDVISDPLESVQPQPEQWLDKDFLKIDKPRDISLKFQAATNSWTLTRASETNDWELADAKPGEKLDSTKLYGITSPFSSARFNDVEPLTDGNITNHAVLTVKTFDGFTYVANIGAKHVDDYPVTFKISANFPAERVAAKDEKPAEKEKLDAAFKTEHDKQATKFAREQKCEKWIYTLPAYSVDELLKVRGQILEEVNKEEPANSEPKSN
jgi:hypothetical protein